MFVVTKRFTRSHCALFPAYSFSPCGQVLMLVLVMQEAYHGAENCLRMRNLEGKSTFRAWKSRHTWEIITFINLYVTLYVFHFSSDCASVVPDKKLEIAC